MAIPALVYVGVVGGEGELMRGWAIPAATDIAFAMGVLGLLQRCPASLRLFLLTVAIVDDIGAVLVIALFYTANIKLGWLAASGAVVVAMLVLNKMRVARFWPYILLAIVLWYFVLNSGIHATIAGVVAALCIPMVGPDDQTMVERMEHGLAPWSAYLVVPVFGFANAGVPLAGMGMEQILAAAAAIAAGLFLGKQVGIFAAIFAADKLGFAPRPDEASWTEIWGVSMLQDRFHHVAFISGLAFTGQQLWINEAKIGILLGSPISAVVGYAILRMSATHPDDARSPYIDDKVD